VALSRHLHRIAPVIACGLVLATGGCAVGGGSSGRESPSASRGGTIRGAGETMPSPLLAAWAGSFRHHVGTDVRYEAIGFSRGLSEFTATLADFGVTDAPLNEVEVATAASGRSHPEHFPVAFAAVSVVYRLPGVSGLRLDGATLASIFLGRVSRWNSPAIRRLNPERRLPPTAITVVHRADAAGTTRLLTSFLVDASTAWSRRAGADEAVAWPVGAGMSSNAELARAVSARVGAIGYLEPGTDRRPGLQRAALANRTGRFIAPAPAAIAAATRGLPEPPADLRFIAVDASPDPGAYPIASPVFVQVYRDLCRAKIASDHARHVRQWLRFVLGTAGQRLAATTPGFAALPVDLAARARSAASRLACDGKRL